MNRLCLFFVALIACCVCASARQYRVADVPNVHLSDSTRFVSNPDGVLSQAAVASLDRELQALRRATTAEVAVVAVDDIAPDSDPDRFATDLFTAWGIGKADRDNGVLLLLVKDQRSVTIRTGQGAEGVITDLAAGRIIRNVMTPRFREGDYDGGISEGVGRIAALISDPVSAEELRSNEPNDGRAGHGDDNDADFLWNLFLWMAAILGGGSLIVVLWRIAATRRLDEVTRYQELDKLKMPMLFAAFLSLGLALPAYLILNGKMRRVRLHPRKCANCGSQMERLGEEEDNNYLTHSQDLEERINSIDYDVWLCPTCHNTEVIPYINRQSAYTECPRCHARTFAIHSTRTVVAPTTTRNGQGIKSYQCRNCGYHEDKSYTIPRREDLGAAAAGAGAILGSRRGGGFGGGGFGGGSFGGGSTMGGGATGRW